MAVRLVNTAIVSKYGGTRSKYRGTFCLYLQCENATTVFYKIFRTLMLYYMFFVLVVIVFVVLVVVAGVSSSCATCLLPRMKRD